MTTSSRAATLDDVRTLVRFADDRILAMGMDADLILAGRLQQIDAMLAAEGAQVDLERWAALHEADDIRTNGVRAMLARAVALLDRMQDDGLEDESGRLLLVRSALGDAVRDAAVA